MKNKYRFRIVENCVVTLLCWIVAAFSIYQEDQQVMSKPDVLVTCFVVLACIQTIRTLCIWMRSYRIK